MKKIIFMKWGAYMNNEQIVNSIKILCKEHNITVTKLEEMLDMSQGLIGRWNKSDPSLSKIIDIANYFNVSIDEVVGFKRNIEDEFLKSLIQSTDNFSVKWRLLDNLDIEMLTTLREYMKEHIYINNSCRYFKFNNGYIYINASYDKNITNPPLLQMFIRPAPDSELIKQDYTKEQLEILWIKILYAMGDKEVDYLRAEDLKQAFILNHSKTNSNSNVNGKT